MKALKWIGIIFAVLLLLVVSAAVLVPLLVDPNDYRDEIETVVEDATGRDLEITGDIKLSVWPSLSLEMDKVTLSNAAGFEAQHFAQVDRASVSVQIMPLLDDRLEADTVTLKGLRLNLEVDEQGNNNWADLAGPDKQADQAESGSGSDAAGLAALSIGGIDISDARVSWNDRANKQKVAIQDMALATGPIELHEPIDVDMSFKLVGQAPQVNATVGLETQLELDLTAKRYRARGTRLSVLSDSQEFGYKQVNLNLTSDVLADLGQEIVSLGDLKLDGDVDLIEPAIKATTQINAGLMYHTGMQTLRGEGASLNFDASGAGLGLGDKGTAAGTLNTDIGLDLSAQRYDFTNFKLDAKARGETLPGGAADVKLSSNVAVDLAGDTAKLKDLMLDALGAYLTGHVDVSQLQKAPKAQGKLSLAELSPRDLMKKLALDIPQTSDPKVLNKASAEFEFAGSADAVKLTGLTLILDDTKMTGKAGVANFAKLAVNFALKVDQIDVDRYLPPVAAESGDQDQTGETKATVSQSATSNAPASSSGTSASPAGGNPKTATASAAGLIPVDLIREQNINGVLDIGKLKVNNLKANNVHLKVKAKDGVMNLDPFKASLYDGNAALALNLNVAGKTPTFRTSQQVTNVQIGDLLKDLNGEDKLIGTANIKANVSGAGNDEAAIKRTLDGGFSLNMSNGAYKGVNIADLIRKAKAALKGGASNAADGTQQTDFSELSISGKINDGVITSNDLSAKSPLLRIGGDGQVNLPADQIDYTVVAKIVGTSKGQGGDDLNDLKGLTIPVKVKGSLSDPGFTPDLGRVLSEEAKRKAKKKIEEKLQKKLGGKLGGVLGGLLGGQKQESAPAQEPQQQQQQQQEAPKPEEAVKGLLKGLFGR